MKEINANSPAELDSILRETAIVVLARGRGRSKKQTEDWVRRTILASHANSKYFSYPLKAISSDRPDLDILLPNKNIGVEITECVPSSYAAAVAYGNRHYPNAIVDRSMFAWDQTPMSNEQHAKFFNNYGAKLHGPGWAGDSVEYEWANAILDCIRRKTQDLNAPGFREFSEYWLAIYDNFEGPALDIEKAVSLLKTGMLHSQKKSRIYGRVLIETGDVLVVVESDGKIFQLPVRC